MIHNFKINSLTNEVFCDKNAITGAGSNGTKQEDYELSETFYINNHSRRTCAFQVKLTTRGISLRRETGEKFKEQIIDISDIIGSRCMNGQQQRRASSFICSKSFAVKSSSSEERSLSDASAYLHIYAYVMTKSGRRERTVLTLRFRTFDKYEDNIVEAEKWHHAIRVHKSSLVKSSVVDLKDERRMLVLLNPKAGSGKAREYFQQQIETILKEADLPYEMHVTKRPNYAKEFVCMNCGGSIPPPWRGIIIVGGDALYSEVINGLLQMPDWKEVLSNLPIGIIPCGSANSLARTIAHIYREPYYPKPIMNAALTAVGGHTALMDVVRIETQRQISFSILSVGWGLMSEMDLKSERLRGIQRLKMWSVVQGHIRSYHGKISYLPIGDSIKVNSSNLEEACGQQQPNKQSTKPFTTNLSVRRNWSLNNTHLHDEATKDCDNHNDDDVDDDNDNDDDEFRDVISLETTGNLSRSISFYSATSRKSAFYSTADSTYDSLSGSSEIGNESDQQQQLQKKTSQIYNPDQIFGPSPTLAPSLITPVPESWQTEEGNFVMVQAAYRTYLGADCYFAPTSELNDGVVYLVVIRDGINKSDLMHFLFNMSSGTHLANAKNDFIQVVPVSAFRIEPSDNDGVVTIDGKRIDCGAIQGEIFQGVVRVMVPK